MRPFNRGHLKVASVLLFFAAILCLFFQDVFSTWYRESGRARPATVPRPTQVPNKRVTKSLSELRKMTELNDRILMFNHVPNAGSEMFVLILRWLQGKNSFRHIRLGGVKSGRLDLDEQKELFEEMSDIIQDLAVPLSFDCSTYFTNFTKFGWHLPTHFNVIRNPDDIVSKFGNKLKDLSAIYTTEEAEMNEEQMILKIVENNLAIPYFCGHDTNCTDINSKWALEKAKENVKRFYPVVGVFELPSETVFVLQNKLTFYFDGAQDIYLRKFKEKHNKWKNKTLLKKSFINKKLKNLLVLEYEFYYWVKSRLLSQIDIQNRRKTYQYDN